ncbi:cohesin subunit SA-1 isoform X2 [Nerophis ophidion]|uniref:cohesin subunit SA-1 isoform X2 n=1 Tax=Nerophis ophidion TaxID=159077 RepID=UPI002ADF05BF|nr:cohesin subunit SA-1 isoform X2 [Nerophis ophidion]
MSSNDFDSSDDLTDLDKDYVVPAKTTKRKKQALEQSLLPRRQRHKAALSATPGSPSSPISSPPEASQQQHSSQGTRHSSPGPRARPGNSGARGISADDIYKAVTSGKTAIVVVVDEWMDSYKQSRETGLLVLINFIVQSCGCKGEVSRDMLDSMPNADIIAKLTKQFDMDSATYPLSTPGPMQKKIKAGLCEFTRILVRSCGSRVIYDEYLFPSVLSLLTGLTDSQVRAFRHTSTLLAIKIMSGMTEIVVTVSLQLHPVQRHYDKEKSKQTHEQDARRLEDLQAGIKELQEKKEELLSMTNTAFRGIFVHRYRDKLMEIRAACMEELGVWIKTDPENFLNDGCIKYLGWMIHDKQSLVRLKCVRSLQPLYQKKEFIGRLELFTSRFKERLVNMVMDVDPEVAVETVKLLLLINQLKSLIDSEKQSGNIVGFFQILISFHIQSEFHNHGTYLVDSLWDVAGSELKDWETMTTLLQQEAGLMDEEEGALIELMICVIRQAAEAKPPVGRVSAKKALNMKEKKIQEQDRRHITTHFIPLLPQLLTKYSADAGKVKLLLQAPLYFNLAMYSSVHWMNKHLDQLLSQICEIVEKHTDTAVLEACSRLFSVLCSDRYAFSSRARLIFSQLVDSLTECFSTYFNDLLQGTADDDVYSAATALKRIAVLSSARDLTAWRLFDSCIHLLESRMESRDLDEELIVSALRCSAWHLMWTNENVRHSAPTEEELRCLSKEVGSFCDICQGCLCVDQAEIRDEAFQLLCDLLCFYSSNHVHNDSTLQSLYYLPNDFLRTELANFLMDYIFSDSDIVATEDEHEEEIALLQKKRLQLAGYCRLVLVRVLDYEAATDIFKHYHMYFRDFGDIIKETILKMWDIGHVTCARTLCLSMQQLFSVMLMEEDVSRQDIGKIRDLARMFAVNFGPDLLRARKPLLALHMDGIEFAFRVQQEGEEESYPNVAFLEILSEFSLKLPEQEQTQLSTYLKAQCPDAALSWKAVKVYQSSLGGRASARPRLESAGSMGAVTPQSAQAAKRRKTTAQGSSSSTVESSWLESGNLPSHLSTPALTSTVQKHPATQPGPREDVILESDVGSNLTESEDEFSSGSQMRKVNLSRRLPSSIGQQSSTLDPKELNTQLTLLSLIEEDAAEQEVDEYESDSSYTLPSTRHSTSVMDELFDSSPAHI